MADPGVYTVTAAGKSYTVRVDLLGEACHLDATGWTVKRKCTVEGLIGEGPGQQVAAVGAIIITPITPPMQLGFSHPVVTDARLESYDPKPVSNGNCEVVVTYRERFGGSFTNTTIKGGTSLCQVQTNVNVDGNLMTVQFPTGAKKQTVTATKLAPQSVFNATRVEYINPAAKSEAYTGTVNTGGVPWDVGSSPRCWLCTGITYESHDRGISWTVNYSFQKQNEKDAANDVGGWDWTEVAVNAADGQAYGDFINSNGDAAPEPFQIYEDVDFSVFAFLI